MHKPGTTVSIARTLRLRTFFLGSAAAHLVLLSGYHAPSDYALVQLAAPPIMAELTRGSHKPADPVAHTPRPGTTHAINRGTAPHHGPTRPTQAAQEHATSTNALKTSLRQQMAEHFHYPETARRRGWQGRVVVGLWVSRTEGLVDLRVVRSSRFRVLDDDALGTLSRIGELETVRDRLPTTRQYIELPVHYRLTEG